MNFLVGVLMTLVVMVPHGDDEITVLPEIQAADHAIVVIMTDGAATSRCGSIGYAACEARRRASTEAFLAETAPRAEVVWVGQPDGRLTSRYVELVAVNICEGDCEVLAAGSDYGHPDHDAVREGVASVGGSAYDGTLREDPTTVRAMLRYYGWLLHSDQYEIVGLVS